MGFADLVGDWRWGSICDGREVPGGWPEMFRVKSLQQRMALYLLLPVAVLMTTMGWFLFVYARGNLLKEYREAAVLKLQRAAHQVDMRLSEPKLWMLIFGKTGGEARPEIVQAWVVRQLNELEGVVGASLERADASRVTGSMPEQRMMGMHGSVMFERAEITQVNPPRLDAGDGHGTVTMSSDLLASNNLKVGQLDVTMRFDDLIRNALSTGWSRNETASLIDDQGKVLICSASGDTRYFCSDENTFHAVLKAMQETTSGTIMGASGAAGEVIGFYRLREAPWTLVLTARAGDILAPITRFRDIFLVTGALFTLLILMLIRSVVGRTVASIREVSAAAKRVATGDLHVHLANGSHDEVGQLVQSFNTMVAQLEERLRLKEALDLAMEVQQNLLPVKPPELDGLDIAGTCIYSDETGGDYFDFLQFPELGRGRIGIAVGDVAGHGISAALLMATARAMVRARILQPGTLAQVVNDVNRLLCYDTERTGDFITLFLAVLDTNSRELHWVRAGHAPALLYDPNTDSFEELRGEGFSLGIDNSLSVSEYRYAGWNPAKLLFIGTDGIWETENPDGEQFGMERLRTILRQHCGSSSQHIMEVVLAALNEFRGNADHEDDITMVILKSS